VKKLHGNGSSAESTTTAEPQAPPFRRGPGRPPKHLQDQAVATVPPPARGPKGRPKGELVVDVSKLMVKPAVVELKVVGLAPLLVHNFGAKAIKMILDKQTGEAKTMRAKKVPFDEFLGSLYIIDSKRVPKTKLEAGGQWGFCPDTFGFPASGFKKAMVSACSFIEGIPKTWVRSLIHIQGDLLPIKYEKLVMRQDTVMVGPYGRKVADIRFRGEFHGWSVKLRLSYNANALKPEQIALLVNNAGFCIGVGEWRPEKDGSHGTFAIGD
jgi:hypothetical protein